MRKSLIQKSLLLSALFILFTLTNVSAQSNVFNLVVKEDLMDCVGVAPQKCYQVKYSNSKDWEAFYSQISGFKYEEGYRYTLKVRRTRLQNVPADASSYNYKLIRVVKKVKMNTNPAKGNSMLTYITDHSWKLIRLDGRDLKEVQPTINFDFNKKVISGNGGCNGFFGSLELKKDELTFSKIGSTLMFCEGEKSKVEGEFLHSLEKGPYRFDVADQTLNFYKDNKLVLMFAKTEKQKK